MLLSLAATRQKETSSTITYVHLQVVAQSFLGVGAPEALLVGVVALVVFGPKGLADVSPHHLHAELAFVA